ncbi:glycosyl transferase group 1 [Bacteroides coprosuis DSM 18011]|uniref:Glycosyl transferase group 1 n=1 Tax=Bacteroides coprosuis DSM 18011 TaxID=679937 RepID=F3ZS23_9BACE|nr:glycosyl transferase group 1 [Bacteroides coprosuis DSM 18011]
MKLIHVFSIFGTAESFFDGQFKYLTDQGYEIVVVSSDAPNTDAFCKRNGVRFVPLNIPRSVSPMAIVKAVKSICSLIRKEKADAVFGHTPVGALCAMIAARLCGVKNRVYYRHGLIYTTMKGLKHTIFKAEEKFVASLATSVINVSHSLSKLAVADGLNEAEKQYVIGHGTCGGVDAHNIFNPSLIDKDKLTFLKEKLGLVNVNVIFGFCGRICNDKGIPELVDAFEMFQKSHSNVKSKLLFIGAFDTRDDVSEDKKQQIEANQDIVISGYIDKVEIPYYYSMLDVFVFPSHREGFGMCVLEASAMEKPILNSRAHGCVDAIVEHKTGEYIDLSAESICEGMGKMLDVNLRNILGKNGRKCVLEWYDFKVMWPLVDDLYKKILR